MQETYGYPPLTPLIKDQILSHNARSLYDIADRAMAPTHQAWVDEAGAALRRAVQGAG